MAFYRGTASRHVTRRSRLSPRLRRDRRQAGDTLIEVLVSVILLGLVGGTMLVGFATAARGDAEEHSAATDTVVARDFAAALTAAPYELCAPASYYQANSGYTPPTGATATVSKVEYWTLNSNPATFSVRSCDPSAGQAIATGDTGLQRITYTVANQRAGIAETLTRTLLKRFDGAYKEPVGDPRPGGSTCTISDPTQVDSNWVDEFAGQTNTVHSSDDHMNILYLAGSRRYSYLRFNIAPGAKCDEGGTLPAGADIKSATLRLYTYNIGGLPACGANSCWHVLERVRSNWSASSLTWNNQPCPTGYGQSCLASGAASTILFEHGTGALNWGARYQYIEAPDLLSDVRAFYAAPSTDYGWVIKEACATTYGKACGDISPGFQFRSKYGTPTERPAMEIVYQ